MNTRRASSPVGISSSRCCRAPTTPAIPPCSCVVTAAPSGPLHDSGARRESGEDDAANGFVAPGWQGSGMTSEASGSRPHDWWKSAVIYQIYPRSFADSNGDGVGDLEGIRRHLDHLEWLPPPRGPAAGTRRPLAHLEWLGVAAVWLSPFYRSPMADFGYDVSDYCDVDPLFGDLDA